MANSLLWQYKTHLLPAPIKCCKGDKEGRTSRNVINERYQRWVISDTEEPCLETLYRLNTEIPAPFAANRSCKCRPRAGHRLVNSENLEILAAITATVARWQLPEAVPILGEKLGRKQVMRLVPFFPRGLRREFARALAAIGTDDAKAQLAEFTKDMDSEVRHISRGMPAPTGA